MLYFDHAATSFPKPQCVIDACTEALKHAGNPGRGAHEAALWSSRCLYRTRESLARLFHCDPMGTAFMQNATMALNTAIHQVDGEIVTTAMEHNSVLRPCEHRGNYRVVKAPGGRLDPEAVIEAIGPETSAVIMTHASNLTGEIYDIAAVGRHCQKNGILFIVDAAQTTGVVPIDMEAMNIDMLVFSGHKGTLGPTGTGALILGSRYLKQNKIRPLLCGGTGSQSHRLTQPQNMPDLLESGTQNIHGIAGLCAGIDHVLEIGVKKIMAHEQQLASQFIDGIKAIPGMTIYRPDSRRVGTVAFNINGIEASEICDALASHDICVRGGLHCAPLAHQSVGSGNLGAVRFSFGYTNTPAEVATAITTLWAIAQ